MTNEEIFYEVANRIKKNAQYIDGYEYEIGDDYGNWLSYVPDENYIHFLKETIVLEDGYEDAIVVDFELEDFDFEYFLDVASAFDYLFEGIEGDSTKKEI